MPYKAKKPCAVRSCPNLTSNRFCEVHTKTESNIYEKYSRDPATQKRYNGEWRKVRRQYLNQHPLCELCLIEGRYVPAEQVHHIVELACGGSHDFSNLQALCVSCHSRITAKEHLSPK